MERDETVSLTRAAEVLGVHYMTAYRYVRTGLLDAEQVSGQWRVPVSALDAFRSGQAERGARRRPGGSPSPSRPGDDERRSIAVADRLVAGDEGGAWRVVQEALSSGAEPEAVYLDVLGPALRTIGDRWAAGRVSIAEEHRASVVAMRLVARLGAWRGRPGRTRGTVVLAGAPGDRHAIPTAMVADLLRSRGFRVSDLGADTPADELADVAAGEDRLVAVGICATTPLDGPAEGAVRRAVRTTRERTGRPVLLGGAAVTAADAQRLGADHWTGGARDVLALLDDRLAPERGRPDPEAGT